MKILSISILIQGSTKDSVNFLTKHEDVSQFGFFQKGGVSESITFLSRLLAKRQELGKPLQSYKKENYLVYVLGRMNGLISVLITDNDYPSEVAASLCHKSLKVYEEEWNGKWKEMTITADNQLQSKKLGPMMEKYQDPSNADDLKMIIKDIEETKEIIHQSLQSVLQRGEKMEDLVDSSNDLSYSTKILYSTASENNECCIIS